MNCPEKRGSEDDKLGQIMKSLTNEECDDLFSRIIELYKRRGILFDKLHSIIPEISAFIKEDDNKSRRYDEEKKRLQNGKLDNTKQILRNYDDINKDKINKQENDGLRKIFSAKDIKFGNSLKRNNKDKKNVNENRQIDDHVITKNVFQNVDKHIKYKHPISAKITHHVNTDESSSPECNNYNNSICSSLNDRSKDTANTVDDFYYSDNNTDSVYSYCYSVYETESDVVSDYDHENYYCYGSCSDKEKNNKNNIEKKKMVADYNHERNLKYDVILTQKSDNNNNNSNKHLTKILSNYWNGESYRGCSIHRSTQKGKKYEGEKDNDKNNTEFNTFKNQGPCTSRETSSDIGSLSIQYALDKSRKTWKSCDNFNCFDYELLNTTGEYTSNGTNTLVSPSYSDQQNSSRVDSPRVSSFRELSSKMMTLQKSRKENSSGALLSMDMSDIQEVSYTNDDVLDFLTNDRNVMYD